MHSLNMVMNLEVISTPSHIAARLMSLMRMMSIFMSILEHNEISIETWTKMEIDLIMLSLKYIQSWLWKCCEIKFELMKPFLNPHPIC